MIAGFEWLQGPMLLISTRFRTLAFTVNQFDSAGKTTFSGLFSSVVAKANAFEENLAKLGRLRAELLDISSDN